MKAYLSFMFIRFKTLMQYRGVAIAGFLTQFAFGFIYLFLYEAFYKNNIETPLEWSELVSYIWLGQIFFCLTYAATDDSYIFNCVKNGQIAYELVRPISLYFHWYSRIISSRVTNVLLRGIPLFILIQFLPSIYKISSAASFEAFFLFLIVLILGVILIANISMILYVIMLKTKCPKGLFGILTCTSAFFGGSYIAIPFMPKALQTIANILPFRFSSDTPYRIYIGNISTNEAFNCILIQIIWIVITFLIGYFSINKSIKKVEVQGG